MLPYSDARSSITESTWITYVMSCPWCDEALFHFEAVPDTPFLAKRSSDPMIHSQNGKQFCVCPECANQVDVWGEAGSVLVPDRLN